MPRTGAEDYERAINSVLGVYCQGGFKVVEIRCDNEFRAVMDRIAAMQNPPIRMNYANAQEHVPEAERNNRTIKERARATYHRLPFRHLPRIMVKYLVIESAHNTSTIKLGTNGKASSGKRTRHFDIKLFYVTDLIERGEVNIKYCPTEEMVADYYTKPVVGSKFQYFRDIIMNFTGTVPQIGQQECVG